MCVGFASLFLLLLIAFTSPAVMARWSGLPYLWVVGLSSAASGLAIILAFRGRSPVFRLPGRLLLAWNLLFLLALVGAILPYQVAFPNDPSGYPLLEPAAGVVGPAALVLALLLHPVLYTDAAILLGRLSGPGISTPRLAGGMALAALYQVLLIFAHVFTTIYDYVPVVGPFFRDRYWLVYALPGLVLALAVSAVKEPLELSRAPEYQRWPAFSAAALALLTLWMAARTTYLPLAAPGTQGLRAMTYNIQQGYGADGGKNFAGQLAVISERQPDILGLQESDTARIAGGNSDVVRYLAESLRMYSYYGPRPVTGTFGIALLSRYPIENPRTYYLHSTGEQTAVILAEIHAAGKPYTIMVTHLGNGGPLVQQQQILSLLPGRQNVILMGDFNFRPGSEPYLQTVAALQDGWLAAAEKEINPPGQDVDRRIDHFFLSPNLGAVFAENIGKGPSDHPGVVLEIPFAP
jgi:endonuclease/exonuclease/phosphatase family metal-dependent hydrolase